VATGVSLWWVLGLRTMLRLARGERGGNFIIDRAVKLRWVGKVVVNWDFPVALRWPSASAFALANDPVVSIVTRFGGLFGQNGSPIYLQDCHQP